MRKQRHISLRTAAVRKHRHISASLCPSRVISAPSRKHRLARDDAAALERQLLQHREEEGGLARAVRPDQPDPVAAREVVAEAGEDAPLAARAARRLEAKQ